MSFSTSVIACLLVLSLSVSCLNSQISEVPWE